MKFAIDVILKKTLSCCFEQGKLKKTVFPNYVIESAQKIPNMAILQPIYP